ncbi:MAG: phosphodiester glycosidase family protein [Bacteroidales bacterium]|nr:phosphodiester glycosidase family protein [Bacteroidales bacterium]
MKRRSVLIFCLLVILLVLSGPLTGQITGFEKVKWDRERIAPGLIWKSAHTILNDSIPQNLNVLTVNTRRRRIALYYESGKNSVLSKQAVNSGALAAVNGGFFNIRDGGSVAYIRTGGLIKDSDTSKIWSRNANMTGSFLVNKTGDVFIEEAHTNSWYDTHPEYGEVLVTGPLLLSGNKRIQLPLTPLVVNKHPRTVVGKKSKHKIVIVTIDGRTDQAAGLTINEVTQLMQLLGCKDAVNFDGGGSTTMWISGKPFNGVVNMPCDNKKFDHEGERAVSDILVIR